MYSDSAYDKLFTTGIQENDVVSYSCIPLEIAYIERLRKLPSIQTSQLKEFCKRLNMTRIPLSSDDVAKAIDDEELQNIFFNSRANPYQMAALMAMTYQTWWDDSLLQQFHEIYD